MDDELRQRIDALTLLILCLLGLQGFQLGGPVGLAVALLFGGGVVYTFFPTFGPEPVSRT